MPLKIEDGENRGQQNIFLWKMGGFRKIWQYYVPEQDSDMLFDQTNGQTDKKQTNIANYILIDTRGKFS